MYKVSLYGLYLLGFLLFLSVDKALFVEHISDMEVSSEFLRALIGICVILGFPLLLYLILIANTDFFAFIYLLLIPAIASLVPYLQAKSGKLKQTSVQLRINETKFLKLFLEHTMERPLPFLIIIRMLPVAPFNLTSLICGSLRIGIVVYFLVTALSIFLYAVVIRVALIEIGLFKKMSAIFAELFIQS